MTRWLVIVGLLVLLAIRVAIGQEPIVTLDGAQTTADRLLNVTPERMGRNLESLIAAIDEPLSDQEVRIGHDGVVRFVQARQSENYMIVFVSKNCPFCGAVKPGLAKARANGWDIRLVDVDDPLVAGTTRSGLELIHRYYERVGVPENERTVPAFFVVTETTPGRVLPQPKLVTVQPQTLTGVLARENIRHRR